MTDINARMNHRRAQYLARQQEESERARARLLIEQAEKLFEQERRRLTRTSLSQNLGDKLRAAGFR